MSVDKIILYDLESDGRCRCWSLNVWKIRLVLNYKKIPYETRWVPLREVQDTMKALGLEPNTPAPFQHPYTVPTILIPSSSSNKEPRPIMNSLLIAPYLEETYPTPSLHLSTSPFAEVQEVVNQTMISLVPYWLPKISQTVMTDEDKKWSYEIRAPEAGYPMEEWENVPASACWEAACPGFERLEAMWGEVEGGPFLLGREVSYGDFVILGMLGMLGRMGREDLEMCLKWEGVRELWEASQEWMERDD